MKHLKRLLIKTCILILLLIKINHSHAQITNFGTDFWFGFTEVYDTSLTTGASYAVYISSLVNTTGNISIPGQGFSQNFSVSPGIITSITLPPAMVRVITSETLENKAIHITTNDNVAVYAHTYHLHRSEASLILPVTALGSDYYVASYNPSGTFPSEFLIIGSGVPVTVEITPTANTIGGNLANVPFNVTINPNQIYQVQSRVGDLTGSRVRALNSTDKFSVIGGGKFPAVPSPPGSGTKDPIYEQLFPVSTWGKDYIFIPTPLLNDDICRIMASQNGTIININGTQVATLNAGQFYEQSIINPSSISANLPISVARYLKCGNCVANPVASPSSAQRMSDPAMVIINANEQMYLDTITFYASSNFQIDSNYVQVITRTADVNTIFLDGNNMGANFSVIAANPFYSYMNMPIDTGTHTLASNGCGFLAYITGLGGAESYAYAAGVSLRNISINSLAPDSACIGDNIQFSGGSFGSATNWSWNFGDGDTSNIQNPSHTYSSVGNYTVTLVITTNNGCPDTLTQSIKIIPCCTTFFTQNPIICSGDSIVINGSVYTTTGTFNDTIFNGVANGCDSIITTNLTVNPIATSTDIQIACDSLTWIDGVTYTISTNTPTDTLVAANGCDSVITLNLTINNSTTGIDTRTACDSLTWIDGITYLASTNMPKDTLIATNGCDSIVTLNLTIDSTTSGTDVQTACDSLTWIDGITYSSNTSTPTFTITSGSANGCDSVVTLNLTINSTGAFTQNFTICSGDSVVVNSNIYTTSGTFNDTIFNGAANGCDSIITTNLTVTPIATFTQNPVICQGDSVIVNGNVYTSTGTFIDTLQNAAVSGCDSLVTSNLTVSPAASFTQNFTECQGFSVSVGTNTYNTSGSFIDTLSTLVGCDSIVTTNLTIITSSSITQNFVECEGFSITVGTNTYTTTGTFTDILNSCDTVITNLTIYPAPQITLIKADDNCGENIGSVAANVVSANPPITYNWNTGSTDSIISNLPAGTYSIVVTDSTGCSNLNSVEVLDLEIDCDFFVYVPNAFTPNGDGNNDVFFVNAKGVESLSVKIYNRWGNKVFEINDVNDIWDGTYKGKKQNTAVFVYVLEATFLNGKTVTKSGNVNLIR